MMLCKFKNAVTFSLNSSMCEIKCFIGCEYKLAKDKVMFYYCALANDAVERSLLRWPSRPKHHAPCPTLLSAVHFRSIALEPGSECNLDIRDLWSWPTLNQNQVTWLKKSCSKTSFFTIVAMPSGLNSRFYHGFRSEDWVGRMAG